MAYTEPAIVPDRDGSGRFAKGRPNGRPVGAQNKVTVALKDALMAALDAQDGGAQAYFERLARSDPRTFCTLLAKLIPHEMKLKGAGDGVPLLILKNYTGLSDEELAAIDKVRDGKRSISA